MYPKLRRLPSRSLISLLFVLLVVGAASSAAAQPEADADAALDESSGDAGFDGEFFLQGKDGDFRLEIGGRLQPQFELVSVEEGDDRGIGVASLFIRRARLSMSGHLFTPRLTFGFQSEFSGDVELLDYYLNYVFVDDLLHGRVGSWRVPFMRTEINSSSSLLLVDRSLITDVFGEDRDVGLALHNNYKKAPTFEWAAGIFTGAADELGQVSFDEEAAPTFLSPSLAARVAYNHGDIKAYSTGDFAGGPLRFSLGAAGVASLGLEPGVAVQGLDREDQSSLKGTVDYMLKVHGFSSSGAYTVATVQDGESLADQELFVSGFFVQAGYLIGETFQPAARYSRLDPEGDEEPTHEALGGLNIYFYGHSLKWQTDFGAIIEEAPNDTKTNYRLRTQLSLDF